MQSSSFSSAKSGHSSIRSWLHSIPSPPLSASPENPILPPPPSQYKRRRAASESAMESREGSPSKRRRVVDNGEDTSSVAPRDSASQATPSLSNLTPATRLAPSSASGKRTSSPTRDLFSDLRECTPSIKIDRPTSTHSASLRPCLDVIEREVGRGFIPSYFRDRVEKLSASLPPDSHYDLNDTRTHAELEKLWDKVEEICNAAIECSRIQQNESVWCTEVVVPLLQLGLTRVPMLKPFSVQSCSINPDFAPTTLRKQKVHKKTDYTFLFHQYNADVMDLCDKVRRAYPHSTINHTTDPAIKRNIHCSGVEVKADYGNMPEAAIQLAIWLSAGLQNQRRLWNLGHPKLHCSNEQDKFSYDKIPLAVGFTVVGFSWHLYIARGSARDELGSSEQVQSFDIVGPWKEFGAVTDDPAGVLKAIRLVEAVGAYAQEVFWPGMKDDIFKPLLATAAETEMET